MNNERKPKFVFNYKSYSIKKNFVENIFIKKKIIYNTINTRLKIIFIYYIIIIE
jgi:hypothetical protein